MFFFSSRRRHTRLQGDWSSDVCSSDLDELKRRSEIQSVVAQRHLLLLTCATKDRTNFTTRAEEIRRLALEDVEILPFRNVRMAQQRQLQQLTLGHLARDAGENIENRQRSFSQTRFECRHVTPVAHQHRRLVAVKRIDCRTISTRISFVDDVRSEE